MGASGNWLTVEDVLAIHDDQIRRFGGLSGLKSLPLLESACAAPLNHQSYAGENDIVRLDEHLAHAIARNHPFNDGNKRTALIAFLEYLHLHRLRIEIEDSPQHQPLAELVEQLAAGSITAAQFAAALRPHLVEI